MTTSELPFQLRRELCPPTGNRRAVFLFPGQGKIHPAAFLPLQDRHPGFLQSLRGFDAVAQRLQLPQPSPLLFQREDLRRAPDPKHILALNIFQLAAETALFSLLRSRGLEASALLGHSFGEFAALHCAGILSQEEVLRVVALREELSPEPGLCGTLLAVSRGAEELQHLGLTKHFELANRNSPSQVAIAVAQHDVKILLRELRSKRVPAVELSAIARPYHSSLLAGAAELFRKRLEALEIRPGRCQFPLISSVQGLHFSAGAVPETKALLDLLAKQLSSPVDFLGQVREAAPGAHGFVELGMHGVLTAFAKDILGKNFSGPLLSIPQLLYLPAAAEQAAPRKTFQVGTGTYFPLVSRFIAKVTGYEVEEISLEQRLEEDLRVDSIKKAEILFRSLDEARLASDSRFEISRLRQVGDLVEFLERRAKEQDGEESRAAPPEFGLYTSEWVRAPLVFPPAPAAGGIRDIGVDELYATPDLEALCRRLHAATTPGMNTLLRLRLADRWGESMDMPAISKLLQRLGRFEQLLIRPLNHPLVLLSAGEDGPMARGLRSFFLSLCRERRSFRFRFALDPHAKIAEHWRQELADPFAIDVRWTERERLAGGYLPVVAPQAGSIPRVVLAIGGSRGILRSYLSRMPVTGSSVLCFSGRAAPAEEAVRQAREIFTVRFSEVCYFQADAGSATDIQALVRKVRDRFGGIDLVLNAAGSEFSRLLDQKGEEEILTELSSKIMAVRNLEAQFHGTSNPPRIVHFNSITGSFGNLGQTCYGFANGFAGACGSQGSVHLAWAPLDQVGMTESLGILQILKSSGLDLVPEEKIPELLNTVAISGKKSDQPDGVVHCFTPKDRFALNLKAVWNADVEKVLGSPGTGRTPVFRRVLDSTRDQFLRDHLINRRSIAPGCWGLAAMQLLGGAAFQRLSEVRSFELMNLIPLDGEPVEVCLGAEFDGVSCLRARIWSKLNHFSAGLYDAAPTTGALRASERFDRKLVMSEYYSERFAPYGPLFRVLDDVFLSDRGKLLGVHRPGGRVFTGHRALDLLANLYEACLQMCGARALFEQKLSLVPVRIDRLTHFSAAWSEKVLVSSPSGIRRQREEGRWAADIEVFNSHGEKLLEVENLIGFQVNSFHEAPVRTTPAEVRA